MKKNLSQTYRECERYLFPSPPVQNLPKKTAEHYFNLVASSDSYDLEFSRKWKNDRIFHSRVHLLFTHHLADNWPNIKSFYAGVENEGFLHPQWRKTFEFIEPLDFTKVFLIAVGFDLESSAQIRYKLTIEFMEPPSWLPQFRQQVSRDDFTLFDQQPVLVTFEGAKEGLPASKIHYRFFHEEFGQPKVQKALEQVKVPHIFGRLPSCTQLILSWAKEGGNLVYIATKATQLWFDDQSLQQQQQLGLFDFGGHPPSLFRFLPADLNSNRLTDINYYYLVRHPESKIPAG